MRQGRLISTATAALAALAIAPAAASAAPSPLADDLSGGTPDANTWVVEPGVLRLKPTTVSASFSSALADNWSWTSTAWPSAGTAIGGTGSLTVDGAHAHDANPAPTYAPGQVVEFRAKFSSDVFENVGLGDTFNDAPWAMFSTGGNSGSITLPYGLYARTSATPLPVGVEPKNELITDVPLDVSHNYRIEWTGSEVKYYVDDLLKATHTATMTGPMTSQMRPAVSDFNKNDLALTVDWLGMSPYPSSRTGRFESRIHDADDGRAVWGSLAATNAAGVTFETRSGNSAASLSSYELVDTNGAIKSPPGKFIQYRATLANADPNIAPRLGGVSISYEIDSTAPTTTIGGTGTTVTFSSPADDLAHFECSVDGGAFATCTSPKNYSALAPGSHTISVRAVDKAGNVGDAVSRTVSITGGGTIPPGDDDETDDDTTAPDVTIGSRKLRSSASGKVKLRLTCPDDEDSCEITVRLKRAGKTLAGKILTLSGGDSEKVTLKLSQKMRRKLAARGRLKAKLVVTASDEAGNKDRAKYSVTIRPR